jgi:hypothetical protein
MQPKRQYPITTEVPRHVSNVERLAILPIDAPKTKEIESAITAETRVIMPVNAPNAGRRCLNRQAKEKEKVHSED